MPPFVAALLGGLLNLAVPLAGRVLIGLGFAAVTYTGLSVTLGWLKDEAVARIQGMPSDVVLMLGYMQVGVALSIITSAIATRLVLDGLSAGGAISKLVKQ